MKFFAECINFLVMGVNVQALEIGWDSFVFSFLQLCVVVAPTAPTTILSAGNLVWHLPYQTTVPFVSMDNANLMFFATGVLRQAHALTIP